MNIGIDKAKLELKISVTEDDFPRVQEIRKLMAYPEWAALEEAYFNVREAWLKLIQDVSNSEANERKAWLKAAIFKGFEGTADLPATILREADKLETQEEKEETPDAGWAGNDL